MELIREFKQLIKNDALIAGGKGASLGEMTGAGILVPPGFVVLTSVFDRFLEETDLNVEIDSILDRVNYKEIHTVDDASGKIQDLIIRAKMPEDIKKEILKFFKSLGAKYVAVRSSASAEDSASAAWAGQLDSFLNTTEKDLLEKVQKCWASLFTPRAIFYRFEKGMHGEKISVAVVVQKMVNSEMSGVAFSVHPVTEDRNQLVIEAGFGLGEAIVSGSVTPDGYVVEKDPRRIIDVNVNTQAKALYRNSKGGPSTGSGQANIWKDLTEEEGSKQVLTEKQINELSEIILNIENHYKFPVDIEWAFENNKFYIVQSRPITTLKSKTGEDNGVVRILEKKKEPECHKLKWIKEGEAPLDKEGFLSILLDDPLLYPVTIRVTKRTGLEEGVAAYFDRKNNACLIYTSQDEKRGEWGYKFFLNEKKFNKYLKEVQGVYRAAKKFREKVAKIKLEKASPKKILEIFTDIDALIEAKVLTYFTIDSYSWKIEESLQMELANLVPEKEFSNVLGILMLQKERNGLEDERYSWLKEVISPALKKHLTVGEVKKDKSLLKNIKKHLDAYKNYSAGYGIKMWDIDHYFRLLEEDLSKGRKAIEGELVQLRDKDKISKTKKREIIKKYKLEEELVRKAEILGKLAEIRLDLRIKAWSFYMYLFCQLMGIFSENTGLTVREIGLLRYEEFIKLLRSNLKITKEIRQKIKERGKGNILMATIPGEGDLLLIGKAADDKFYSKIEPKKELSEIKTFKGEIACKKGIVKGEVFKFIYGAPDFSERISKFPEGAILVANLTMPVLMPAIRKAKAMVTDGGGITCHAAIVSRELGIPCIIGTDIATKLLKDGDLIEVDTDKGIVKILKKLDDKK